MGCLGRTGCSHLQERGSMIPIASPGRVDGEPAAPVRRSSARPPPTPVAIVEQSDARDPGTLRPSPRRRATLGVATSVVPYIALSVAMYLALGVSDLLALALAVPTAAFLVRTFIVFHDCSHGSFSNPSARTRGSG